MRIPAGALSPHQPCLSAGQVAADVPRGLHHAAVPQRHRDPEARPGVGLPEEEHLGGGGGGGAAHEPHGRRLQRRV